MFVWGSIVTFWHFSTLLHTFTMKFVDISISLLKTVLFTFRSFLITLFKCFNQLNVISDWLNTSAMSMSLTLVIELYGYHKLDKCTSMFLGLWLRLVFMLGVWSFGAELLSCGNLGFKDFLVKFYCSKKLGEEDLGSQKNLVFGLSQGPNFYLKIKEWVFRKNLTK